MDIALRLATPADADAVAGLNAVVHQLHADARPDFFAPAQASELLDWVRARLQQPNTRCWLAEHDGQPLGYLLAFIHTHAANCFCPARTSVELDQIAVVPQHRRSGVARMLFDAVMAEAARAGADRVELNVWSFNDDARRAFERFGFRARALRMERML